jgi:hypothetical protein
MVCPPSRSRPSGFAWDWIQDTDTSEPQTWPAGHPLHPDVCGLHWGWRSGYVFFALEGHWEQEPQKPVGFSYHLAGGTTPMLVELPAKFSGATITTLSLALDLDVVLNNGEVLRESLSTHSRSGDALATNLKEGVRRAFRIKSIDSDLYQVALTEATPAAAALPGPFDKLRGGAHQGPPHSRYASPSACPK